MTKSRISLADALSLLKQNKLSQEYEINFLADDLVEATDAIKLGALGIDVPEEKIYYDDASITEDEAFSGEWIEIESDLEDYKKHISIQLNVDAEVQDWLSTSKVDLDELVSELITGFYKSAKVLEK